MSDDTQPISLAAARAVKENNGALWGVKDVLFDASARSANADAMIIVWREKMADGGTKTHWSQCGPDVHTALGLLSLAAHGILTPKE